MANLPNRRRFRMLLAIFGLCLGSLVICEVIDPLIASEYNWFQSIPDGFLQDTHLDEHDDDFVLIDQVIGNFAPVNTDQERSSKIRGSSFCLSPALPPPKAS